MKASSSRMLLGAIAVWVFTFAYWLPLLPFMVLLGRWDRGECFYRIVRGWGHATLWLSGIRVVVETADGGPNPLDTRAARVVVVNHPSTLEVLWGASICPRGPMAIGKQELVYIPVVNLAWWVMGFALVDRKNTVRAIQQLGAVSRRLVDDKLTLFVAPEGTRSHDGEVGPFKKGAFHVAVEAQAPIQPLAVLGTYELMPRQAWLTRPGVIRLRFLPTIETRGKSSADVHALASQARASIVGALEEMRRLPRNGSS